MGSDHEKEKEKDSYLNTKDHVEEMSGLLIMRQVDKNLQSYNFQNKPFYLFNFRNLLPSFAEEFELGRLCFGMQLLGWKSSKPQNSRRKLVCEKWVSISNEIKYDN